MKGNKSLFLRRAAALSAAVCIAFLFVLGSVPACADTEEFTFSINAGSGVYLDSEFSESWFAESSYTYNHDMARTSLALSMAGFSEDTARNWEKWGEDDSLVAQDRRSNIEDALRRMGFKDLRFFHYGDMLSSTRDKAAYAVGRKTDVAGSTLIAVVVRGGGYGGEWVSNFQVGEGNDYHEGFKQAADDILSGVFDAMHDASGRVKIWITGYSRGAAAANLVGAFLDDYASGSELLDPEDIYCYTFACPLTVKKELLPHLKLYLNIFNIINPGDIVPMVPPADWGFTRYGTTKELDRKADDEVYSRVDRNYEALSGRLAASQTKMKNDGYRLENTVLFDRYFKWKYGDKGFSSRINVNSAKAGEDMLGLLMKVFPEPRDADRLLESVREYLEMASRKQLSAETGMYRSPSAADIYDSLYFRYGDPFSQAYDSTYYAFDRLYVMPGWAMSAVDAGLEIVNDIPKYFDDIPAWGQVALFIGKGYLDYIKDSYCMTLSELEEKLELSDEIDRQLRIIFSLFTLHDVDAEKIYNDLVALGNIGAILEFVVSAAPDLFDLGTSHQPLLYYSWMMLDEKSVFGRANK